MAPTERSMPAVRTTMRLRAAQDADDGDLLQDRRQRSRLEEVVGEQRPKMTSATKSTIIGTAEGVWCSQCCSFFSALSGSWNSATVSAAPASPPHRFPRPPSRRSTWLPLPGPLPGPVMPRAARWPPLHVSLAD
jgi:hypothetical protein